MAEILEKPRRGDSGRRGSQPGQAAPAHGFAVERVEPGDLGRLRADWLALSRRAVEANPFLTRGFAAAWLGQLAEADGFAVATVWRTDAHGQRRLVGLWPFKADSRRWGAPLGLAEGMIRTFAPLGIPLLDRDDGVEAAATLLDWLRSGPPAAGLMLLPMVNEDGAAAGCLAEAMRARGLMHHPLGRLWRAVALPLERQGYVERSVSRRRRKHLARLDRRLRDLGSVTMDVATAPDAAADGVEEFLRLELAGWKGQRAGTAALQQPDRAAFFRSLAREMAEDGAVRVHALRLDGRAIAAGIVLLGHDGAVFWKIAYDEAFAHYSPGVQLALAITHDFLAQPGLAMIDSVADADHPMIDHLWRERLTVADWLIDLTPGGSWRAPAALALERSRTAARAAVKAVLHGLRLR